MEKKKLTTIISGFLFVVIAVGVGIGLYSYFENKKEPTLSVPKNLNYNEATSTFTFDSVEKATSYLIDINGKEYSTETNTFNFDILDESTNFKVQALDSTNEYKTSEWSEVFNFTIDKNVITKSSVNVFINSFLTQWLVKIVNIHFYEGKMYTVAVFNNGRFIQLYTLRTSFNEKVDNLIDALEHADSQITRVIEVENIVEYNSAQSMLNSGDLVGLLKNYSDRGYNISVVTNQTALTKYDDTFMIYGTYKVTNGIETKYIVSQIECVIDNFGPGLKANYTTKVEDPAKRSLYQVGEHEINSDSGLGQYFELISSSISN